MTFTVNSGPKSGHQVREQRIINLLKKIREGGWRKVLDVLMSAREASAVEHEAWDWRERSLARGRRMLVQRVTRGGEQGVWWRRQRWSSEGESAELTAGGWRCLRLGGVVAVALELEVRLELQVDKREHGWVTVINQAKKIGILSRGYLRSKELALTLKVRK